MEHCTEYILVMADIHANLRALRAVVKDARRRYRSVASALKIWFLGDLFGRGPQPMETWTRLLTIYRPETIIIGNHDRGIAGLDNNILTPSGDWLGRFRDSAWQVILAHRRELATAGLLELREDGEPLGGEVLTRLRSLPIVYSPRPGIYLVHGGLERPLETGAVRAETLMNRLGWEYVKSPEHARYTLDALRWLFEWASSQPDQTACQPGPRGPELVLVGHYHRNALYIEGAASPQWINPVKMDSPYMLRPRAEAPILVSLGSVGFPREDHDRDARYAVLCLKKPGTCSITFHKAAYDRQAVRAKMRSKRYPGEIIRYLYAPGEKEDAVRTRKIDQEGSL